MGAITSDIDPIDDQDLRLSVLNIPGSQNMYFDLLAFGKPMSLQGEQVDSPEISIFDDSTDKILEHVQGKIWDGQFINEIFDKNQKAYAIFDVAVAKPYYQYPEFADPKNFRPETIFPPLNVLRRLARIEAMRSFKLFEMDEKKGLDESIKIMDFGQKIQDSQGGLLTFLVGTAIKDTGLSVFNVLLNKSTLPSNELLAYVDILDKYKSSEKGTINWVKAEYRFNIQIMSADDFDGLLAISRGYIGSYFSDRKIKNSFYYRPNETKKLFAERARSQIVKANIPCATLNDEYASQPMIKDARSVKLFFTENAAGKIISEIVAASLNNAHIKKCNVEFIASVNQLTITLHAYEKEKGFLPSNLEQLVPKYIANVPRDPFDGKSLRYSQQKKIIYSVGKGGLDKGGSLGEDWRTMENPTISVTTKY